MEYITSISGDISPDGTVSLSENKVGHVCPKCKFQHHWSSYVFAHWDLELEHHCHCATIVSLKKGIVKIKDVRLEKMSDLY